MPLTRRRPHVLMVGGPDVDARIQLIQRLAGFETSVLGSSAALAHAFAAAGVRYGCYPLHRGANALADARTLLCLWRQFRRLQPDIVHAFDTKPAVWARLAARLAGVPVVVGTLPGLGALYASNALPTRIVRAVYQSLQQLACAVSDATVFQNQADARQFIAAGVTPAAKACVIPGSGVDADAFDPARFAPRARARTRKQLGIAPGAPVVTMISRLIRPKGVLDFGAAAHQVRQAHPEAHFLLAGPLDEQSLDRLLPAELAALSNSVAWLGRQKDVAAILAISDVFVLPSYYREGIPRALLEAAAMGCAIVTTDTPGCAEVVQHGVNGLLVPVRRPEALAQAITRMLERPGLRERYGHESRGRVLTMFDLSIVAEKTCALYNGLIDKGSSRDTRMAALDAEALALEQPSVGGSPTW